MTQSQPVTPDRIMQIGSAFAASKALLSAVELGVFTELAHQPADLGSLSWRLGLHPRSAADFLDTLVALKLLDRDGGVYRNTPEADTFLDRAKPSYVGGMLEMMNSRLYGFWGSLTEAVRTGKPQNEARNDPDLFRKLYADRDRLRVFLEAMSGLSKVAAQAIATKFDWSKYRTFIDIGTAQGCLPVQVALAHGHLTGGGFDLPAVRPVYEDYVRAHELGGRLKFFEGDMFEGPLPKADVLVMGHILHDWGLEAKKALVAKAYEALPKGGALLVYDALIDDERRSNLGGLLMSLNMLIETRDGYDYTGAQGKAWMREAGFRETYVEPLTGPDAMVVGIK
jgi:hypothetical protein